MSKGKNLKRIISVLFVTIAAVGVSVAFLASSSSAQGNTINGAFCMPTHGHVLHAGHDRRTNGRGLYES